MRQSLTAHREILRRLPLDYPYTRETAVAYAASILPGFNGAELDELERAGRIDWIQYNGAPHYSSSFLDTLCKTDPIFASRAGSAWGGGVDVKYIGGVRRELIAKLKENGTMTLRFGVRETLRLREDLFRPGMRLRAYLPLPCASEGQHDITVSAPDANHLSAPTADQPVAFFEQTLRENRDFTAEYRLTREARYVDLASLRPSADQPGFDLEEQPPHIAFTPYLRVLAEELTEGLTDPLAKARRFYDYVTTNVRYSYMRSYFCLESISDSCARNLVGDCGVQVLMFVTLCRCVGIPAVFHGGWRAGLEAYDGQRRLAAGPPELYVPRLGAVLHCPGGLALCGPGLRRRGLARGRSGDLELQLRQCGPAARRDEHGLSGGLRRAGALLPHRPLRQPVRRNGNGRTWSSGRRI